MAARAVALAALACRADEAAVAVYVDVETEEIILSLDPNLSLEASYASALAKTDDTTYH